MKIKDLKQPYRRMAEYFTDKGNINNDLEKAFDWSTITYRFWNYVNLGKYPPITSDAKRNLPDDFDFSGEEVSLNQKYTQLAKEGKFDELPDTCEFSEPVELEVWDVTSICLNKIITGKFKGLFMAVNPNDDKDYRTFEHAQLPTKKIDFSEFKTGDVVEVVRNDNEYIYGLLWQQDEYDLNLTFSDKSDKVKCVLKKDIKSITKIK
jgi:hypothetical protein